MAALVTLLIRSNYFVDHSSRNHISRKDQRIYTWMCIYWICMSLNITSSIFRNLYLYEGWEAENERETECKTIKKSNANRTRFTDGTGEVKPTCLFLTRSLASWLDFFLTVNPCLLNHMLETVCHTDIFTLLAHALAHHACLGASVSGGESEDHKGMQNWERECERGWFTSFTCTISHGGLYFHNTLVSYAFQTYFPVCFSVCHVHRLRVS